MRCSRIQAKRFRYQRLTIIYGDSRIMGDLIEFKVATYGYSWE